MASTDAIPVPKKNTAYRLTAPLLDADGDPVAGATIDSGLASGAGKARVSKDGGASVNSTNNVTEIDGGFYFLDLTATEMNADTVAVMIRTTTAGAKNTPVVMYPQETGDILVTANQVTDKSGYFLATVDSPTATSGTAQAGAANTITLAAGSSSVTDIFAGLQICITSGTGSLQTRTIIAYNGTTKVATVDRNWATNPDNTSFYCVLRQQSPKLDANSAVTVAGFVAGAIQAASFTAGAIDATAIATDAITSAELAASAVTEIAAGVWDEARSGHVAAGSFGQMLQAIRTGTAQAGAGSSITLDAGASATDNFYNASLIQIIGGTGAGQSRFISGYTGATKVATVQGNWLTAPDATSVFVIFPFGTIASIGTVTGNVNGSVASLGTGAITSASFAAGAIDAAAIATDAIGSAELAASAITEIAAGVWDEPFASHLAAGTFGRINQDIRDGTAQAGAAGSITLDAGANANDGFYTNQLIQLIAGTGAGQSRQISGYTGATKVATVSPNWTVTPDNTTTFVIAPFAPGSGASAGTIAAAVWDEARSGHVAAGSFGQGVASVQGNVTGSVGSVASGGITAASFAAGAIDANSIATDAIGSAEIAASAASEIALAVWDSPRTSSTAPGTFGRSNQISRDNTAQAGAAGSITLDTGASATDGFYTGQVCYIQAGTGAGQLRSITGYTGATKVATVSPNWATNPDNTSVFVLLPGETVFPLTTTQTAAAVWDEARSGHVTAGTFGQGVASVQGNVTGSTASIGSGGITAATFAAGAIDAAAIATDAIGSAELAASAITEIAGGVWDEARSGHVTAGTFGQGVASVQGNVTGSTASIASGGITAASFAAGAIDANAIATDAIGSAEIAASAAAEIAGQVWEEARASHTTAGSFGQGVASVQGNVTGSTNSVTTGVIVTTNNDKTGYSLSATESSVLHNGTAQGGSGNTITLAAGASATTDLYKGLTVKVVSGTGAAQARTIIGYNGSTKVATVDRAWATTPDATSVYGLEATDNPQLDPNLNVTVEALSSNALTNIKAQVTAVLTTDTFAELGGIPSATSTLKDKITFIFMMMRNRSTQTSTTLTLRNDGDTANVGTATVSDDSTTFVRGKIA